MNNNAYTGTKTDFYVASDEIAETVNLALELKRPLLVEGEPGCGKTMLAYSIAAELNLEKPIKISVKSTSQARDLLYRLDTLRRLQEAQDPQNESAKFLYPYLFLGPLGAAIHRKERCVVLIDEIDKADIDFPNDLLDVLDTFTFQIPDLPIEEEPQCQKQKGFGREVEAHKENRPFVVITSNREKRLPEPFLRRCLYVHLDFPDDREVLSEIVRKNTGLTPKQLDQDVLLAAINAFLAIRRRALDGDARKPPTTSELIDWVKILHWKEETAKVAAPDDNDTLFPPYWRVLFKTKQDLDTYIRLVSDE